MAENTKKNEEAKKNEVAEKKNEVEAINPGNLDLEGFSDVAREGASTGLESVDQTDLKLPKVKLVQMQSEEHSKNEIPAGHFYNAITKESTPELNCIMLALGKSRVMWPETFKRGDKPLCRSFDGKTKTEGIGDGICAKCQYSQWGQDGEKPKCNLGYVWLGIDEYNRPFRMNVKGTSMTPTKDFLNTIIPKLNRGGKQLGIFVFKLKLSADKESNEKGTYHVLKYDIVGTIDKKDYEDLEGMSSSLQELFLKAIDQDNLTVEGIEEDDTDDGNTESGALF